MIKLKKKRVSYIHGGGMFFRKPVEAKSQDDVQKCIEILEGAKLSAHRRRDALMCAAAIAPIAEIAAKIAVLYYSRNSALEPYYAAKDARDAARLSHNISILEWIKSGCQVFLGKKRETKYIFIDDCSPISYSSENSVVGFLDANNKTTFDSLCVAILDKMCFAGDRYMDASHDWHSKSYLEKEVNLSTFVGGLYSSFPVSIGCLSLAVDLWNSRNTPRATNRRVSTLYLTDEERQTITDGYKNSGLDKPDWEMHVDEMIEELKSFRNGLKLRT